MKVSKVKGISPRYPVLAPVNTYERTIATLLAHVRLPNRTDTSVRDALKRAANELFKGRMEALKMLAPPTGSVPDRISRYNDSVSALRTKHARMINKISILGTSPKSALLSRLSTDTKVENKS